MFNIEEVEELAYKNTRIKNKKIYIMGVGKSGNLGKHFSDLLKSISLVHIF